MKKEIQAIEAAIEKEPDTAKPVLRKRDLLSTGSTLLNLACSGNPFGGFARGKYFFLVGDSASGKTFLSMTCFAEATVNKYFKDFRLIYDNVEDGCLLNLSKLFNDEVARRIEPPAQDDDGSPVYSSNIEEFYFHVDDAVQTGKPFIYILDSMDSLTSESEETKFNEKKDAHKKGKVIAGSYGDGKAKKNSEGMRNALRGVRQTGSILIILSQTRDNIGFGFEKKTRSGGRALKFYATIEIWSSLIGQIRKTIKGKTRKIGIKTKLETKKNRITGKLAEVSMDIYPSYGIDDIGSCIDYLIDEGWWKVKKQSVDASEFGVLLPREKLIKHIEDNNEIKKLQTITGQCWQAIDEACSLKRKGRYDLGTH